MTTTTRTLKRTLTRAIAAYAAEFDRLTDLDLSPTAIERRLDALHSAVETAARAYEKALKDHVVAGQ